MEIPDAPILSVYVVWHPCYEDGDRIAERLRAHFRRDRNRSVAGEPGLSVLFRSDTEPGKPVPLPVGWDDAKATAVILLVDPILSNDHAWQRYIRDLSQQTQRRGFLTRLIPVAMGPDSLKLELDVQALRWDLWDGDHAERERRLIRDVSHEFIRMLRYSLRLIDQTETAEAALANYLNQKVHVFISHSKHDKDGKRIAQSFRDWIHKHSPMGSFFDVHDIPAGTSFKDVLRMRISSGVVMALHTDTYSSREWCRWEVIESKRSHVPLVVIDCLRDGDLRSMPYLGNVPIVRMCPDRMNRMNTVADCLLDETLRYWMWRCQVEPYRQHRPELFFTARPPELISVPSHQRGPSPTIIHPDPPLSTREAELFSEIVPRIRVCTLTQWIEENP